MKEHVISFRDVSYTYPGNESETLRDVSFDIRAGGTVIVLGGSGSGKSTILKLALGLIKPDSGTVSVGGIDITNVKESQLMPIREKVGMVFQEGALFDSLTVSENISYRLEEQGLLSEDQLMAQVARMLDIVGLSGFGDRIPSDLSGGQRRRVAVARAMAHSPELILYDEPTTGLDPLTAQTICELIVKLRDVEGVTSVLVTHQLKDAFFVAERFLDNEGGESSYKRIDSDSVSTSAYFVVLNDGRLIFQGNQQSLLETDEPYVCQFLEGHILQIRR